MLETFEALRVEERSGVDLGTLAIKQLEKYAAENDELKQSARRMKEDYASKIEQLQDEARTQRDKIHSQQHQQELEVKYFTLKTMSPQFVLAIICCATASGSQVAERTHGTQTQK